VFLDRVPVTGWKEGSALVELIGKIRLATPVDEPKTAPSPEVIPLKKS
jgi:hypothetical protein